MREDLVHVPEEGAPGATGQHHARGQPAARQTADPALGQTGAEMVGGAQTNVCVRVCKTDPHYSLTYELVISNPSGTCRASWSCWSMKTGAQTTLTP